MNPNLCQDSHPEAVDVEIQQVDAAEVDERWSGVGNKAQPRWVWQASDHPRGVVLASVCGTREDDVFVPWQEV